MTPLIVDVEWQNGCRWSATMRPPGQEVIRICLSQPEVGVDWDGGPLILWSVWGAPYCPTKGHIETNFCTTSCLGVLKLLGGGFPRRGEAILYHTGPLYSLFSGWKGGYKIFLLGAALNHSKVRISRRCWLLSNYRCAAPPRTCPQSHLCTHAPLSVRPTLRMPASLLPLLLTSFNSVKPCVSCFGFHVTYTGLPCFCGISFLSLSLNWL